MMTQVPEVTQPSVVYVQAAPAPDRMSVGGVLGVLLLAGIPGLCFAARHHSVWGSIWRGWVATVFLIAAAAIVMGTFQ